MLASSSEVATGRGSWVELMPGGCQSLSQEREVVDVATESEVDRPLA